MDIGRLNRRIRIERHDGSLDALNGPDPDGWKLVVEVWANIRHLSGVESIRSDQASSFVRASMRIRYRPGIDAAMRVVYRGQVYEIKSVLPGEEHRDRLDIVCETRASNVQLG